MLLAALAGPAAGVMIARGDLAVECGYERLAEVQEEILGACEAAHVPVVWATQVLETLAKTGLPSRAEITDAAMGGRAECVMLNKGPHIVDAMRTLDDILRRMQSHQAKKRPLLRHPLPHLGLRGNSAAAHQFLVDHQPGGRQQVVGHDGLHVGDLDEFGLDAGTGGGFPRHGFELLAVGAAGAQNLDGEHGVSPFGIGRFLRACNCTLMATLQPSQGGYK
jgi:hypothetical protein